MLLNQKWFINSIYVLTSVSLAEMSRLPFGASKLLLNDPWTRLLCIWFKNSPSWLLKLGSSTRVTYEEFASVSNIFLMRKNKKIQHWLQFQSVLSFHLYNYICGIIHNNYYSFFYLVLLVSLYITFCLYIPFQCCQHIAIWLQLTIKCSVIWWQTCSGKVLVLVITQNYTIFNMHLKELAKRKYAAFSKFFYGFLNLNLNLSSELAYRSIKLKSIFFFSS